MVLFTRPSRTADIEQILVRGVHGPGEIHRDEPYLDSLIQRAVERKKRFEANPQKHTYEEACYGKKVETNQ